MRYFETRFLLEAEEYLASLDSKALKKLLFNIDLAEQTNDPRLFKKLQQDIWEFRTLYRGSQIRLLAFWDKTASEATFVIATHGFNKKTDKVPANEIDRAVRQRERFFKTKLK